MGVTEELCPTCKKGYLIEEADTKTRALHYYCNNCFKYLEEDIPEDSLEYNFYNGDLATGNMSDDEVDLLIGSLFGKSFV